MNPETHVSIQSQEEPKPADTLTERIDSLGITDDSVRAEQSAAKSTMTRLDALNKEIDESADPDPEITVSEGKLNMSEQAAVNAELPEWRAELARREATDHTEASALDVLTQHAKIANSEAAAMAEAREALQKAGVETILVEHKGEDNRPVDDDERLRHEIKELQDGLDGLDQAQKMRNPLLRWALGISSRRSREHAQKLIEEKQDLLDSKAARQANPEAYDRAQKIRANRI